MKMAIYSQKTVQFPRIVLHMFVIIVKKLFKWKCTTWDCSWKWTLVYMAVWPYVCCIRQMDEGEDGGGLLLPMCFSHDLVCFCSKSVQGVIRYSRVAIGMTGSSRQLASSYTVKNSQKNILDNKSNIVLYHQYPKAIAPFVVVLSERYGLKKPFWKAWLPILWTLQVGLTEFDIVKDSLFSTSCL